jgi:hypothetical protein
MGEFSLLDPQLVTMVKATGRSNWTIAAIHNHMVLEKPKMSRRRFKYDHQSNKKCVVGSQQGTKQ